MTPSTASGAPGLAIRYRFRANVARNAGRETFVWRCAGVDAKHPVSPLFGWRLKPSSTRSPTLIEPYARCQRWHMCFGRSRGRQRVDIPAVRSGSRAWNEIIAALRTGALITTFRRAAPARAGALVDERRIVVGDEGGRVRRQNAHAVPAGSLAASLPPLDPVREAGTRTDGMSSHRSAHYHPPLRCARAWRRARRRAAYRCGR
jgi:hypothetical protein